MASLAHHIQKIENGVGQDDLPTEYGTELAEPDPCLAAGGGNA
jgi:hypothetical protein